MKHTYATYYSCSFIDTTIVPTVKVTFEKGCLISRASHIIHIEFGWHNSKQRKGSRLSIRVSQHPGCKDLMMLLVTSCHFFNKTCRQHEHYPHRIHSHRLEVPQQRCFLREVLILPLALSLREVYCHKKI